MVQVEKNIVQKLAVGLLGSFIIKKYPFEELFFRDMALEVKRSVKIPVVLVGGVLSKAGIDSETYIPPGSAIDSSREATLTPSPYTSSFSTVMSPKWIPIRNLPSKWARADP